MPANLKNKQIFLVVVATEKVWLPILKCKIGIVQSTVL